jgi:hypothetical protein
MFIMTAKGGACILFFEVVLLSVFDNKRRLNLSGKNGFFDALMQRGDTIALWSTIKGSSGFNPRPRHYGPPKPQQTRPAGSLEKKFAHVFGDFMAGG